MIWKHFQAIVVKILRNGNIRAVKLTIKCQQGDIEILWYAAYFSYEEYEVRNEILEGGTKLQILYLIINLLSSMRLNKMKWSGSLSKDITNNWITYIYRARGTQKVSERKKLDLLSTKSTGNTSRSVQERYIYSEVTTLLETTFPIETKIRKAKFKRIHDKASLCLRLLLTMTMVVIEMFLVVLFGFAP